MRGSRVVKKSRRRSSSRPGATPRKGLNEASTDPSRLPLREGLAEVQLRAGNAAAARVARTSIQRDDPPPVDRSELVDTAEEAVQSYQIAAGQAIDNVRDRLPSEPAGSIAANGFWLVTTLPGKIKEPGLLAAITFGKDLHDKATKSPMDRKDFLEACQAQADVLYDQMLTRMPNLVNRVERAANKRRASTAKAKYVLAKYLVGNRKRLVARSGEAVVVHIPALRSTMEAQLLMRAATTPHESWTGTTYDDVTMDFRYDIGNVGDPRDPSTMKPRTNPLSDWTVAHKSTRLGPQPTSVSGLATRLNHLHKTHLGPMRTRRMPFKKRLQINISGGSHKGWGMIFITTSASGRSVLKVQPMYLGGDKGDALKAELGGSLVRLGKLAWKDSGGRPPTITELDT